MTSKHVAASTRDPVTIAAWLLVGSLACMLLGRRLVQEGMFLDGLIYAVVSRNLSIGLGSAWSPYFAENLFPVFSEHPPLQFWIESAFFSLLGDYLYVEKLYSLLTTLVLAGMIVVFWRALTVRALRETKLYWLPLLLLLTISSVPWAFANNMLDATLAVLTLAAVYLACCAHESETHSRGLALSAAAGLLTVAAVLTKGPVGLFPLATPLIAWATLKRKPLWPALADTAAIVLVAATAFALLLAWPEPRAFLWRYADAQLFSSLSGRRGDAGGGFSAVLDLTSASAIPLMISFAAIGTARFLRGSADVRTYGRQASFSLLTALSASLPILISPRIHSFYFVASMPFYAMAFALVCAPSVDAVFKAIPGSRAARLPLVAAIGLLAALIYLGVQFGKVGRDDATIHDVRLIGATLCDGKPSCGKVLAICAQAWPHWSLHAYAQRYYQLSLASLQGRPPEILMHRDCGSDTPPGYREQTIGLQEYRLLTTAPPGAEDIEGPVGMVVR